MKSVGGYVVAGFLLVALGTMAIAAGRFEEAYLIARGPNPFASICGRICGAPCEAAWFT